MGMVLGDLDYHQAIQRLDDESPQGLRICRIDGGKAKAGSEGGMVYTP
jgi:hypothetical protein